MNNDTYELIDQYLTGQMTNEEALSFGRNMASEPALNAQVEDSKLVLASIRELGRQELKSKLKRIHREEIVGAAAEQSSDTNHVPARPRALQWKQWAVAASLVGVAVLGAFWALRQTPTDEQLFSEYFQPFELKSTLRGAAEDDLLHQADSLQGIGLFGAAEGKLKQVLAAEPTEPKAQLAMGSCLLSQKRAADALPYLQKAASNPYFEESAKWYQALAYLSLAQPENAKQILETLSNKPSGKYKSQAKQLLERM